jgi:hypothetical protein
LWTPTVRTNSVFSLLARRSQRNRRYLRYRLRHSKESASATGCFDVLAGQMAQALRDELGTDAKGRRYRLNHAVRITKAGVQHTFWAMMGFASHDHMEKTFAQRREQIIGDCYPLKIDVDVYNDMNSDKKQEVQLVLDFTEDVAEREQLENSGDKAAWFTLPSRTSSELGNFGAFVGRKMPCPRFPAFKATRPSFAFCVLLNLANSVFVLSSRNIHNQLG